MTQLHIDLIGVFWSTLASPVLQGSSRRLVSRDDLARFADAVRVATVCMARPPLDTDSDIRCDRMTGHAGRHSWEWSDR